MMKPANHKIGRPLSDKALVSLAIRQEQIKGMATMPFVKTSESVKVVLSKLLQLDKLSERKSMANCALVLDASALKWPTSLLSHLIGESNSDIIVWVCIVYR